MCTGITSWVQIADEQPPLDTLILMRQGKGTRPEVERYRTLRKLISDCEQYGYLEWMRIPE